MNVFRKDDFGSMVFNMLEKKIFFNLCDVFSFRYVFIECGYFVRSLWLSSIFLCLCLYLCLLLVSCIVCELM